LSDLVQANAQLKIALQNYDGLIQNIEAAATLLEAQYAVNAEKIHLLARNRDSQIGLSSAILAMQAIVRELNRSAEAAGDVAGAMVEAVPKSAIVGTASGGDLTSSVRAGIYLGVLGAKSLLGFAASITETVQDGFSLAKEGLQLQTDID